MHAEFVFRSALLVGAAAEFEEMAMRSADTSLRWMIEKWMSPSELSDVRVSRHGGLHVEHRCIQVQARRRGGPLSIYFFRHPDGSWRVFPPERNRPAMRVTSRNDEA